MIIDMSYDDDLTVVVSIRELKEPPPDSDMTHMVGVFAYKSDKFITKWGRMTNGLPKRDDIRYCFDRVLENLEYSNR